MYERCVIILVNKSKTMENISIPDVFDYAGVKGLSNEAVQKLASVRPSTLGQASRISGVTPAAISLVTVFLKKQKGLRRRR